MALILSGTNGLSDVDGTAATPAIRGTDTNTGMFFPAADTIAFSEGGAEVGRFDSSGNLIVNNSLSVAGNNISAVNSMGFRNRIINGEMSIWQRGTSGFTTLGNYACDRWFANAGTSLSAVARSTDVPSSFQYSISVSGTNVAQIVQRIESLNCIDLGGQSVTISFWAKQTSGAGSNSLFLQLLYPNATDNYASVTQIGSNQFFTGTSGWVQYSVTFANIPANAVNGLQLIIGANTAGAATFHITGVQLEAGTVATPFERIDYGRELMLCQRYFQFMPWAQGRWQGGATAFTCSFGLPVAMRATPSPTLIGSPTCHNPFVADGLVVSAVAAWTLTSVGGWVQLTTASTTSGNSGNYNGSTSATSNVQLSAEL